MRDLLCVCVAALLVIVATESLAAQFSYVGHWEGAMVRSGSVRVVRIEILTAAESLEAIVSTPDDPADRRSTEPVVEVPGGVRLELPDLDDIVLTADTILHELRGTVTNGGDSVWVHIKRVVPPASPVPSFRTAERVVQSGAVRIAGTLTLPPGAGPYPVVVWIHGRGGTTRTRTALIEYLASRGIGSFAYDRRGSGESTGDADVATAGDLTADAVAVVRMLANDPRIDPARIGLHATSAGNWIAPRVALEANAAFVIAVVGPAESVFDQQMAVKALRLRTWSPPLSETEIAEGMAYVRSRLTAVTGGGPHDAHLEAASRLRGTPAGQAILLPDDAEARDTSWLRRNSVDPAPDLRRLRVPVLAFFGGADWVVPTSRNAPKLEAHLAAAGNTDVTVIAIPDADHGLNVPASANPWRPLPESVGFRRLSPVYVETMTRWLADRFNHPNRRAPSAADSAAVRAAVLDYVDAIYRSDPDRIRRSVDTTLTKLGHVEDDGEHSLRSMSYAELLDVAADWNRHGHIDPARARRDVIVHEVFGRTASATLFAEWGVDLIQLHKVDGRWRIIHVLWQTLPAPERVSS